MALTNWNDILNKPKGIDEVPEIALTVEQLSASVLSISEDVGEIAGDVQEIALEISQLSASILPYSSEETIKEAIDTKMSETFSTTDPLAVNDTLQIPVNLLGYKVLLITLRRAGKAASLFLVTEKMAAGVYNYGIAGFCDATNYYSITVSQTGLITLVAKSADLGDAHVDIIGIK